MGNVSVTLLGGFAAAVNDVPVPETAWRLKKARELVKLLALAPGHSLHREQAMDVLWRDRGPAAAANNLHQAVYVARRALDAGAIEVREEVLQLTAEVDVDRLELSAADARRARAPAAYRAALSLDEGSSRERRYRLLETVRLYARERLDEAGESPVLDERHARWALTVAEAERSSPRLDRDAANLRAALDTLLERAPVDALRLCVALWPFWLRRIDLHEAQRRFDEALAAAPERTALRAVALLAAAAIDFRSGTLARALTHAEESYALASEIGVGRASALLADARDRYAARDDALGVADVEGRLCDLAKDALSPGKVAPDRTPRTS